MSTLTLIKSKHHMVTANPKLATSMKTLQFSLKEINDKLYRTIIAPDTIPDHTSFIIDTMSTVPSIFSIMDQWGMCIGNTHGIESILKNLNITTLRAEDCVKLIRWME